MWFRLRFLSSTSIFFLLCRAEPAKRGYASGVDPPKPARTVEALEEKLMTIEAKIETVEIENHPWFLGVQFHPEFTSRLQTPNPSILAFVKANLNTEK